MNRHASQNAGMAAFAGLILLVFGFFYPLNPAFDRGEFYKFLFDLFRWTLRLGGISLLVIAGICMMGQRIGLLLDAIVSGVTGGLLLLCAGGWIVYERGVDITNIVVLFIAVMLMREAYTIFTLWRMTLDDENVPKWQQVFGGGQQHGKRPIRQISATVMEEPPVKIASNILPKDGEPPPPEGYLAALAKEKDE